MNRPVDAQDLQAPWFGQNEGYKNAIGDVLEIIDTKIRNSVSNTEYIEESETPIYKALMELRAEYLALKEGEQE